MPTDIRIEQANIEIFGGCNFACDMCPQATGRDKGFNKMMPFAVFQKIVTDAMQYGVKAVSLHGSGEPTLHRDLVLMTKYVADKGLEPSFFTNGLKLTPRLFRQLLEAGIKLITVSVVGATRESYQHWMKKDRFYEVRDNLIACRDIAERLGKRGVFRTRHLVTVEDILDQKAVDAEIALYQKNWVYYLGCDGEIWLMHNWAGQYAGPYDRQSVVAERALRSCGRPFAATLEVRAGGLGDHFGAVVPCPFVLGERDPIAVLGHLDTQTIGEVWNGELYQKLRQAHRESRFNDIPYCNGCDMLVPTKGQALVWSNIEGRHEGGSATSEVDYLAVSPQRQTQPGLVPITIGGTHKVV